MSAPVIANTVQKPNLYAGLKVTASAWGITTPQSPISLIVNSTDGGSDNRTYTSTVTDFKVNYVNCGVYNIGTVQSFTAYFKDNTNTTSQTSAAVPITFALQDNLPEILRNQLLQILIDAPVTIDGKTLKLAKTPYYEPEILKKYPPMGGVFPLLEIASAHVSTDEVKSHIRYRTIVEVELNLYDVDADLTRVNKRLNAFRSAIRNTVDKVDSLKLSTLGVNDAAWDLSEQVINVEEENDTAYILPMKLSVTFNRLLQRN